MTNRFEAEWEAAKVEVAQRYDKARCEGKCLLCYGDKVFRTYDGGGPIEEQCFACSGTGLPEWAYYFAFGTLVDPSVMHRFDPKAKFLAKAVLTGYEKQGLNILEAPGRVVAGVLWEITPEGRKHLDGYEGYPKNYRTIPVTVVCVDGHQKDAFAYQLTVRWK
jgi:gamma-glutamylcyclotransferase (GGCT)/AIG2-like uncharacterized protein YtfP